MLTELEVYNYALGLIGAEPVKDAEDNKRMRLCEMFYPVVLSTVLREHNWNFARETLELTPSVTTPEIELAAKGTQYSLPANCVKVVSLQNYSDEYQVSGPFLYAFKSEGLVIDYIKNDLPPSYWDADFSRLVAVALALELSYSMVQSGQFTTSLIQRYDSVIRTVRFNNATEKSNTTWAGTEFTGARIG